MKKPLSISTLVYGSAFFFVFVCSPTSVAAVDRDPSLLPCALLFVDNDALRPSRMNWKKRIDVCPVLNQGITNTCFLHTAMVSIEGLLQTKGLISPNEHLSRDFYFLKILEHSISREGMFDIMEGGTYSALARHIEKYGIITTGQFHYPGPKQSLFEDDTFLNRLGRGDIYSAVRNAHDAADRKDVGDFAERIAVFRRWVGIEKQPSALISPEKLKLIGFFESDFLRSSYLRESRKAGEPLDEAKFLEALKAIQMNLDAGVPPVDVAFSFKRNDPFSLVSMVSDSRGYRRIRYDSPRSRGESGHSMAVIGYAEENGKISHLLLQNSGGVSVGEDGFFSADLSFLRRYMYEVTVIGPEFLPVPRVRQPVHHP